jgi:probable F420-dependent oxidoreductase
MEIGIALPNIGPMATRDAMFAIADAAERLRFDSLWVGDHITLPRNPKLPYPYSRGTPHYLQPDTAILDPLAVMAAVVSRTKRIKVGTSVLILPYRHPMVTAKLLATIDHLSGGRVILGAGVGWIPEEFAALGADFAARGKVTDEHLRYYREVWSKDDPKVIEEDFQLGGMGFQPKPVKRHIPIWIGGNTTVAMRRAATLGDGIHFIDRLPQELKEDVALFKSVCKEIGRPLKHMTISVRSQVQITEKPLSDAERARPIAGDIRQVTADYRAFKKLGVQHLCLSPRTATPSADDYIQGMERIAKRLVPALKKV